MHSRGRSSSYREERCATRWRVGALGAIATLLATFGVVSVSTSPEAEALIAEGGVGNYRGSIDWVEWTPFSWDSGNAANQTVNLGSVIQDVPVTQTNTRSVAEGAELETVCTLSDIRNEAGGGRPRGNVLRTQVPQTWSALDDMYNIGGTGSSNTMRIGLATSSNSGQKNGITSFGISCSATLKSNGTSASVPLQGLVFADAESNNWVGVSDHLGNDQQENITVTPLSASGEETSGTWRLLDTRKNPANCPTNSVALMSGNSMMFRSTGGQCATTGDGDRDGPASVLFLEGPTSANVWVQGGGTTAVAIGVMISTDFGDAPESYGKAGSLFQPGWQGGRIGTDIQSSGQSSSRPTPNGNSGPWQMPTWGQNSSTRPGSTQQALTYPYWSSGSGRPLYNLSTAASRANTTAPATRLGAYVDAEGEQQHSTAADGDDLAGETNDEDGVALPAEGIVTVPGATYTLPVTATGPGAVAGWIDWNGNGSFDEGEKSNAVELGASETSEVLLSWTVPESASNLTASYLRVRITNQQDGGAYVLAPTGMTTSGEVEDYQVEVRTSDLICQPGNAYSLLQNGTVRHIDMTGTSAELFTLPGTPSGGMTDANALAVGIDGNETIAYAIGRVQNRVGTIYKYSTSAREWDLKFDGTGANYDISGWVVGGAINPYDGHYYFTSSFEDYFYLYSFDGTDVVGKGRLDVGSTAGNGDIAFDAAGNLYVVRGPTGTSAVHVYTIRQSEVSDASGSHELTYATSVSNQDAGFSDINGIAFDIDGSLYLANGSTVARFDPSTLSQLGENVTTGLNDGNITSGDLASCLSPATLTVQKNVVGRANAEDQFNLAVSTGNASVTDVTTEGDEPGIQDEQVGPVAVYVGNSYAVQEAGRETTDLAVDYQSAWQCTAVHTASPWSDAGDGTAFLIAPFPQPAAGTAIGPQVTCVFTNTPVNGVLTWDKADEDGTTFLAGSEWSLTGPDGQAMEILDNEPPDVDGEAGKFRIEGLPWGEYELTEVLPPVGYAPLTVPLTATIEAGATAVAFTTEGDQTVVNTRIPGVVTWSKVAAGVTGDDRYLSGSEWTLTLEGSDPVTVVDCTSAVCPAGAGLDQDPDPGRFLLTRLAWGSYTLTESRAPVGYVADATRTFTIGPADGEVGVLDEFSLGGIENEQQDVPALPLTGGLSTDSFLFLGAGLLTLAGLAGLIHRRRAAAATRT